jgi:hypothetical protein
VSDEKEYTITSLTDFGRVSFDVNNYYQKGQTDELVITVKRKKKVRTNPQNKYYWGYIIPTCLTFYKSNLPALMSDVLKAIKFDVTKEFVHEIFKMMFNKGKSTTKNDTEEMEDMATHIRAYMQQEHELILKLPNEE